MIRAAPSLRTRRPSSSATVVRAPFIDRAVGRLAQSARQRRLEKGQRIARHADGEFAAGRDVDDALMPAVGLFDCLVNRQRIDEFVGDDDDGAAGNVLQRGVPQASARPTSSQPLLLHLLQRRADFDQMQDDRAAESPSTTFAARSASRIRCRVRARARRGARFPARPSAARPPPSTIRSARRTSG